VDRNVGISELKNKTADTTALTLISGEMTAHMFRDTVRMGTEPVNISLSLFSF
jgi:hypothetical protein